MSEIEQNTETTEMASEKTPEVVVEPTTEMSETLEPSNEDMPKTQEGMNWFVLLQCVQGLYFHD